MSCRLLYLVGKLDTGGLERQLCYLLQAIDRTRYQPAVAVWNHDERDIHVSSVRALGVPLYSFPPSSQAIDKLRMFRRLIKRLKPEVVHSYSFYTNIAAAWAVRGTGAIALGSLRNDFEWEKKNAGPLLGRLSARWPRHQISNSRAAAEVGRRSRSVFAPSRLHVVRNGLDLNRYQIKPPPVEGRIRMLGVGYLLPAKRWDRLLVATLELKRRGFDCVTQIAGEGPLRHTLELKAQALGISDRVEFLGHRDDVPKLLEAARFVVHTAENEGCPNAVMEAMASGRAVVGTDVGDIPFLVRDGETGFVISGDDGEALAERVAHLIADPELCRRMGQKGREKAEREFALDRLAAETLASYRAAGWKDVTDKVFSAQRYPIPESR